ncbi:unnamed protein product [Protopolystoma xenopodis]|uniref:Uncharacterized protein n=1 Tax=Protopolystoma xenopodis TaxID=117903 RepID=A0A3S5B9A5_9PLAT|nr:unnamed protein product [Protopolystoma xenopodis]
MQEAKISYSSDYLYRPESGLAPRDAWKSHLWFAFFSSPSATLEHPLNYGHHVFLTMEGQLGSLEEVGQGGYEMANGALF